MSKLDKVIGYETIKEELLQICDMIHNKDVYKKLGATLPKGLLLYGDPGLGKTLLAKCFIEESGLETYTIRKNKPTLNFIREITETFRMAKRNAPTIIFLDDMDKFANEDAEHCDTAEYVAIQSGIDEVKTSEVFVLATANNIDKLPDSLLRSGRFDRKIEVCSPSASDACEIIRHFLKNKKVDENINITDIANMIQYSSCAELETILNEAAIFAAFERHEVITINDIVKAVLRMEYDAPDSHTKTPEENLKKIALHEAGHLVVSEVLCPGSVGLASLRSSGRDTTGGFIRQCKEFDRRPYYILVALAGKAAVELYHSETCASGCISDISRASYEIRRAVSESGTHGFGMIDVATRRSPEMSESMNSRNEAVVQAELERYMLKARDIILKNRSFLEKAAELLLEKETLLYSDVQGLRESVEIVSVPV